MISIIYYSSSISMGDGWDGILPGNNLGLLSWISFNQGVWTLGWIRNSDDRLRV
jgi:hypothetical protein